MLNEMSEFKELKSNPHRDFYNVGKLRLLRQCAEPPSWWLRTAAWAALGRCCRRPPCGLSWPEVCDVYMQEEDWPVASPAWGQASDGAWYDSRWKFLPMLYMFWNVFSSWKNRALSIN